MASDHLNYLLQRRRVRFLPITQCVKARVRFSRQRLQEWKDIDETAQILLKEFAR
jgi:hypothetical protein